MAVETLFSAPTCHVFRVPQGDMLKSETWEGHHIWTGAIQVVNRANGDGAVQLIDGDKLFGECPLYDDPDGPKSLQQATDSRRCFVLRIEQGDQFAYLGINFEDRTVAFNFQSAVLDRNKHKNVESVAVQDRTLHQGERMRVELAGKLRTQQQSGTVGQNFDASASAQTAQAGAFNFKSGISGAGASRRVGAKPAPQDASSAPAPAGLPAPPSVAVAAVQPQVVQRPAQPEFDPFGDMDTQPKAAVPTPAPKPTKPADPLDELFS